MALELRKLVHLIGLDRRAAGPGIADCGVISWSDLFYPGVSPFSRFPSDLASTVTPNVVPWVTSSPPFSISGFPAETLWVAMLAGPPGPTVTRETDNTNPSLVTTMPAPAAGREVALVYTAAGVPAGASAVIEIKTSGGATVVSTTTIIAETYERNLAAPLTQFTWPGGGVVMEVYVTWSGGVPRYETIRHTPQSAADYFAVPGTLPSGYTARTESDTNRGGPFVQGGVSARYHADRRRLKSGPYTTYETLGLITRDSQAGCPALAASDVDAGTVGVATWSATTKYNFWVGGQLRSYHWVPVAKNRIDGNRSVGAGIGIWPSPPLPAQPAYFENHILGPGWRSASLSVSGGSTDPTLTWLVEVRQDNVLIYSRTFTVAEVTAGTTDTVTLPATSPGSSVKVAVRIYTTGTSNTTHSVSATVGLTARCDIPFPFSVASRNAAGTVLVAPGGYLPSVLGTPPNDLSLQTPAAGVLSLAAGKPIAFTPTVSGWYRYTVDGSDTYGCGEGPLSHTIVRSIARGHAGRRFYCKHGGSSSVTAAIAAYTPTPTAIDAAGTALNLTEGGYWAWGTVAATTARTRINVKLDPTGFQMVWGVTVDWSLSDPTVLDPDGSEVWEPFDELAGTHYYGITRWAGTQTTPPASPSPADAYIVASGGTGAWEDLDGKLVAFDDIANAWRVYVPTRGSYVLSATVQDFRWFDGAAWRTPDDPVLSFVVDTPGPQDIHLVLGGFADNSGWGVTVSYDAA